MALAAYECVLSANCISKGHGLKVIKINETKKNHQFIINNKRKTDKAQYGAFNIDQTSLQSALHIYNQYTHTVKQK